MTDIFTLSAKGMADAIRTKELSATELVEAHLDRIAAVNPKLNAVVNLCAARARREAGLADEALAKGSKTGPLHGVPITIKDCFDTAGVVTTGGTLGHMERVPESDATAVARLKAAGAIILGKTNVPEFCLAFETDNLVYGRTNNPYDLERVPGGSSGGEGAIIAAGGSPMGLASDGGGSIRVPAHWNGIAGIKPTNGRVPATGYWPHMPHVLAPTNSIGLLARHVEDLIYTLPVIAGIDEHDIQARPVALRNPADVEIKGLRIAVHCDNGLMPADATTTDVVMTTAALLQQSGCALEEVMPPGLEETLDLFIALYSIDSGKIFKDTLAQAGTEQPHPMLTGFLETLSAHSMTGVEVAALMERWYIYQRRLLGFMQRYDAILCPVHANPALPHGETFNHMSGFYTYMCNLTGWPATVVRGGTAPDGLPIGIQLISRAWREDIALALAQHIEQALDSWEIPNVA